MRAKGSYCYWSAVNGTYALMMQAVVDSARQAGVFKDFHIWTDSPISGATCHPAGQFETRLCLFKLHFLRDQVSRLNYDYFVWLDADNYFVREPPDLLSVMQGSPVHSSLESDACLPGNLREDWYDCTLKDYVTLMRYMGVRSRAIFNVNGGFWIVHHDVIQRFCELAFEFLEIAARAGFEFPDEPGLAYATQMLCGNPYLHTLRQTAQLWASDWTGWYAGRLPDGNAWDFTDYFTFHRFQVNPAIVHAMRSKEALCQRARLRAADSSSAPPLPGQAAGRRGVAASAGRRSTAAQAKSGNGEATSRQQAGAAAGARSKAWRTR